MATLDRLKDARRKLARWMIDFDSPQWKPILDRLTREIDEIEGRSSALDEAAKYA